MKVKFSNECHEIIGSWIFFSLHHYYAIHIMRIAFRLFCSCFQIYLSLEGHLSVCVQFLWDFSSLFFHVGGFWLIRRHCAWFILYILLLLLYYYYYLLFFFWGHLTVYLREYIYLLPICLVTTQMYTNMRTHLYIHLMLFITSFIVKH